MDLEVETSAFNSFDPRRGLSIAKEALGSKDAGVVIQARALLVRLSRGASAGHELRASAPEAAQLVAER